MDDERGPDRRSSPDLASVNRKRKASRGLRVPNDPVPRPSSPDVARVSIADDREIDEFGDRVTQVERASSEAAQIIAASDVPAPIAPVVALDVEAVKDNEHAPTVADHEIESGALEAAPAAPSTDEPKRRPSGANKLIAISDENTSVVRQVRRKIRSIGSDEPMPQAVTDDGPDLSQLEDAVVDEVDEASPIVASLEKSSANKPSEPPIPLETKPKLAPLPVPSTPPPSIDEVHEASAEEVEVDSAEDDDDANAVVVEVARPRSLPPPPPIAAAPAKSEAEPEALESVEAKSEPAPEHDDEDDAPSVEAVADAEVETSADADSEVEVEEPTEEISIPDEIAARPSAAPTPPPRTSAPDASRPPPPPRATPAQAADSPKPNDRPTVVTAESKPRRRHWWEEIFNDDYLRTQRRYTSEQVTSEGNFIEASLGVEKGASVLDVGCGIGRQAVELATRGYEVLGLDLSLAMLSRASDNAQNRGAKLNFLQSDMLEMEFTELFDAAYCVGSTFGFFDDDKNADVIQRLHRALKPGGTLLLEVINRDCAAQQHPAMTWYEADGCVCMEETNFNWFTSRLEGKRTLLLEDGRQREQKFSMRMYSLHELGKILHNAGFRVIEVSGHQKTPGAFFGAASMMLIILAQKRTDEE
ncbi:MAG: methyltransferase domain-containing protein [Polyangiales bacterium]